MIDHKLYIQLEEIYIVRLALPQSSNQQILQHPCNNLRLAEAMCIHRLRRPSHMVQAMCVSSVLRPLPPSTDEWVPRASIDLLHRCPAVLPPCCLPWRSTVIWMTTRGAGTP